MLVDLSMIVVWYVGLVKKFLQLKPGWTVEAIVSSLFSKVAMLAAFLLPMKIIMLLGAVNAPAEYTIAYLPTLTREELIVGLSIVAALCYLLHFWSETHAEQVVKRYADFLLEQSGKTSSYKRTNTTANMAYESATNCLTSIMFTILTFLVMALVYQSLAITVMVYLVFVSLLVLVLVELWPVVAKSIVKNFQGTLSLASSIAFLSCFSFVLVDFLLPINPPTPIYALIGFILLRQMLASFTRTINLVHKMNKKRVVINELFFQGYDEKDKLKKKPGDYWELIEGGARDRWLKVVLEEVTGHGFSMLESSWNQTDTRGVVGFNVAVTGHEPERKNYYVKLFNAHRTDFAIAESTLLDECPLSLLGQDYLGSTMVLAYHCHIFTYEDIDEKAEINLKDARQQLMKQLASCSLPKEFCLSYKRTHPLLWQRINSDMTARLKVVAELTELELVGSVEALIPAIVNKLKSLPNQLLLPIKSSDSIRYCENGELTLLSFYDWKIESVGVGWKIDECGKKSLKVALDESVNNRQELVSIDINDAYLASLMAEFEMRFNAEKFSACYELLPLIIKIMASDNTKIT